MYECPNCAGNLKFDISRQQLYCEQCNTQIDPYCFYKETDAQEAGDPSGDRESEYETRVFICPQCGGRLISEDTTAATFCSFCGASTILDARVSRELRPKSIIPFMKTKEDCRAAYKSLLRRAVFVPKELKDEALIEKFRGIYMPYWVYSFEKKGPVSFSGKKVTRRGNYRITDHYRLECNVEEEYRGLAYDASSAFSDSLSRAIAPFDLKERKAFVPSFLSGFYADAGDVAKQVYFSEAEETVLKDAASCLKKNPLCRKYHAGWGDDGYLLRNALRPSERKAELAMLPVWFLSVRNGSRVSYAVVNGQTGKAAADLPVDGKKYLLCSLLLAVPLFFWLNLFFTLTPGKLLLTAALFAFASILISNGQINRILARESGEEDKGLASVRPASDLWNTGRNRKKRFRKPWSGMGIACLMMLLFYGTALIPSFLRYMMEGVNESRLAGYAAAVFFIVLGVLYALFVPDDGKPFAGGHWKEKRPILGKPSAGIALASVILLVNPASDWFYYIGAIVCMGTVLWAVMDIIRQHNLLAARRLPQLNRRGGDEIE